jgi:hypothetical protein
MVQERNKEVTALSCYTLVSFCPASRAWSRANILSGRMVRALGAREFWRTCNGAGAGASSPDCANRRTSQADGESADLQNRGRFQVGRCRRPAADLHRQPASALRRSPYASECRKEPAVGRMPASSARRPKQRRAACGTSLWGCCASSRVRFRPFASGSLWREISCPCKSG